MALVITVDGFEDQVSGDFFEVFDDVVGFQDDHLMGEGQGHLVSLSVSSLSMSGSVIEGSGESSLRISKGFLLNLRQKKTHSTCEAGCDGDFF